MFNIKRFISYLTWINFKAKQENVGYEPDFNFEPGLNLKYAEKGNIKDLSISILSRFIKN